MVDQLLYRDSRMPALLELLRALPTVEDVPSLAEVALGPLLRLTRARGVLLFVPSRARAARRRRTRRRGRRRARPSRPSCRSAAPSRRRLSAQPRPQAVRDLGEELAAERALLDGLGIELVVPLVGRGRLDGLLAFTAPRGGVYGYGVLHALADAAPQLALALENAALVAERALRERLAALGQLAAVIVHEVKNPLGIIKVSAGALRQRARWTTSRRRRCAPASRTRSTAWTRRCGACSTWRARPSRRCKPTDVGALIRQTLDRLAPELAAARIDVRCDLGATPKVNADAEWIRNALFNLFLNAREAMPSGGALSVRMRPASAGEAAETRELVEIEVEDSGVGMDEATRRQLFRPFFTTRHGGTGLGLAIVKRVIEDHKGAIRVESWVGRGSRFTLTLPL